MQWLLPVLYNPYRRFKQLNVVFWDVKALAQAALITLVGAWCVGFCEENLLSKQSPEKVTRDHVYNQNGYDTVVRDRRSTLVDKHSRPQSLRFFRSRGRRRRVAPGTRMFHSQSPSLSKTAFQQSRRNSEVWRRNPMKNRAISDVYGERPCNRIALKILHFFCILKYLKI